MNLPDWQNPQVLQTNREAPRATLVPFGSRQTALAGDRGLSPYFRLLNGEWDFLYCEDGATPQMCIRDRGCARPQNPRPGRSPRRYSPADASAESTACGAALPESR